MDRRQCILFFLQKMTIATTQQIQRLEFPCNREGHEYFCDCYLEGHRGFGQVCKWLRMLRDEGSIESYPVPRFKTINQGMAHTLTKRAERLLLQEMLDPSNQSEQRSIRRRVRARHARALKLVETSKMLKHQLFSNDVLIWLYRSVSDPEVMDRNSIIQAWDVQIPTLPDLPVIPDLVFKVLHHTMKVTFYVEADRGTETSLQLSEKFAQYWRILSDPQSVVLFIEERTRRDTKRLEQLASRYFPSSGRARFLHTIYDHHKRLSLFKNPVWSSFDSKWSLWDWLTSSFAKVV